MIDEYSPCEINDLNVAINVAKEMVQEVILSALSRAGFFDNAAFHGGTCLRILYGLDRFSEDLDFTLLSDEPPFDINVYKRAVEEEMMSCGIPVVVKVREPRGELPILSLRIISGLRQTLTSLGFRESIVKMAHSQENLTVKMDIDITPPASVQTDIIMKTGYRDYKVRAKTLPVLFAGKTSAVLCRRWGNRVKGRDMYDFRWYIEKGIPIDLVYFAHNMDAKCVKGVEWTRDSLIQALERRFDSLDWQSAYDDVSGFSENELDRDEWSSETFKALAKRIIVSNEES